LRLIVNPHLQTLYAYSLVQTKIPLCTRCGDIVISSLYAEQQVENLQKTANTDLAKNGKND